MIDRLSRVTRADLAIVGAGPAGIAAAVNAAEAGRRVVLLDEGFGPGGQIWRHMPGTPAPRDARPWLARLARSGVTAIFGASVVDARRAAGGDGFIVDCERGLQGYRVEAARLVLATGARERMLPFPGWTLPGVIGVGGAQALLKMGTSFAGKRVVVAGTGPLVLPVAAAIAAAGGRLVLVAEQADAAAVARFAVSLWRRPALLVQAARYRAAFAATRYATHTWVTTASGTERVEGVTVTTGSRTRTLAADVLCVGYGLVGNSEIPVLLGCATSYGGVVVDERQETSVAGVYCAGEPTGIGGVDLSLAEGEIAGLAAAGHADAAVRRYRVRARLRVAAAALERAFVPRAELRDVCTAGTVVCRCEDVTRGALDPRWSSRQAKLYTRAGMGPCQGRVCGPALEFLFGWPPDSVRPPLKPILLSTLLADDVGNDVADDVADAAAP